MESEKRKTLGKIATILRASNFLTLQAAAARAKLSTATYFKIETDQFSGNYQTTQIKLCQAFQISNDFFKKLLELAIHLTQNLNTKDKNNKLITLQILMHKVLKYYLDNELPSGDLIDKNVLSNDTTPISTDNNFSRIMIVLERMNFITPTTLAKKANIDIHTIGSIKSKRTTPSKESLTKIAETLGLTFSILTQLRELEKKLETCLEKITYIEEDEKKTLILQALSYALLDYYYRQASINNNSIKKLYERKK